MYRVIRFFTDAQDSEYAYHEGDIYPHEGVTPSNERIRQLMSGDNFQRVPLIELVKDAKAQSKVKSKDENKVESDESQDEVVWTAEEINKMPFMKLKSVAKKHDVDVKDRDAKDIRSELIEKLGL